MFLFIHDSWVKHCVLEHHSYQAEHLKVYVVETEIIVRPDDTVILGKSDNSSEFAFLCINSRLDLATQTSPCRVVTNPLMIKESRPQRRMSLGVAWLIWL